MSLPFLFRVFFFHNDFINLLINQYVFYLLIVMQVDIIITFFSIYLTIQNSITNFDLTFLSIDLIVTLFYFVTFFQFTKF